VVTFNAETYGANPLRFVTVGIAGGFLGRYQRTDFHEKTREYELFDDRDLWLVRLTLSRDERIALEEALNATRGRWYPYTFFDQNCAYYLQSILAEATGSIPEPSGIISPTSVVEAILRSPLAGQSFIRPAASQRLETLARSAHDHVVARLKADDWQAVAADTIWLASLSTPGRESDGGACGAAARSYRA